MLIKEAGCEDFREGDAIISQKHCNFFVNNGNAKSSDIENLINKVKKKVQEKQNQQFSIFTLGLKLVHYFIEREISFVFSLIFSKESP